MVINSIYGETMPPRITATDITGLSINHSNFVIEYLKDYSPRRAAEAAGFAPDTGHALLNLDVVKAVNDGVLIKRLGASDIDAEWLLLEAVDNHKIARQRGNLAASNTALNLIAKHVFVDAFAAVQVEVNSDKEVMDRLLRGRKRRNEKQDTDNKEDVSFL